MQTRKPRTKPVEKTRTSLLNQIPDGLYYLPDRGPAAIIADEALRIPAYYNAIRFYQKHLGLAPWITYKDGPHGKTEAPSHTAYKILKYRPNRAMNRRVYMELLARDLFHTGEFFAQIRWFNNGGLVGLYPIPRRAVAQIVVDDEWNKAYVVRTGRGLETFMDHEMIHLFLYSHDGIRGVPIIDFYASESLGLQKEIMDTAANYYRRAMKPSGYVTFPGKLTKETLQVYKEGFEKEHGGPKNSGKPLVLAEGGKFERMNDTTAENAKILDALNNVSIVAHWFNLSPAMLGEMEDMHYASLSAENSWNYQRNILPLQAAIELEHNLKIFGLGSDYESRFDVREILRGDPAQQQLIHSGYIQSGVVLRSEVREELGLPFKAGLDTPLAPVNMAPQKEDNADHGKPDNEDPNQQSPV